MTFTHSEFLGASWQSYGDGVWIPHLSTRRSGEGFG
jgi:hypothetical protein